MDQNVLARIVFELVTVLAVGFVAGAICKRIGISMLAGYLLGGVVLGTVILGPLYQKTHEMEHLAEAGVLLLLFSIGIEFSLADLLRMASDRKQDQSGQAESQHDPQPAGVGLQVPSFLFVIFILMVHRLPPRTICLHQLQIQFHID